MMHTFFMQSESVSRALNFTVTFNNNVLFELNKNGCVRAIDTAHEKTTKGSWTNVFHTNQIM